MLGDNGDVEGGKSGEAARGTARDLSLRCGVEGSLSLIDGSLGSFSFVPVLATGRVDEVGGELQLFSELRLEDDGPA